MRLVFLGPPGCGKGTQAELLSKKLNLPAVSVGEMLRSEIKQGTPVGLKIKAVIEAGKLAPDPLVIDVTNAWIESGSPAKGFILDGYPRSISQARALDKILATHNKTLSAAVFFDISEEEVVVRLSGRRTCQKCGAVYHLNFNLPKKPEVCDRCKSSLMLRPDDAPEAVKTRFKEYRRATIPLIQYYEQQGVLSRIPADASIDEVFLNLCQILNLK